MCLLLFFWWILSNYLSWISTNNEIISKTFCYYGTRGNNNIITEGYTGIDCCVSANPTVVANSDWGSKRINMPMLIKLSFLRLVRDRNTVARKIKAVV